jgi:hypothetical protein
MSDQSMRDHNIALGKLLEQQADANDEAARLRAANAELRRVLAGIQRIAEVHDGNGKLADIARRAHAALHKP